MADMFETYSSGLESPAARAAAITPSNETDLTVAARGLYIGGAGAVTLITTGGDEVTFSGLPAGTILPVRTARVKVTGTDATGIVGLW